MSSSEDNESKSYPELDESALLVSQVKLPRVFETNRGSIACPGFIPPTKSKSYPELDELALLVAQVKLLHVFEI